MKFDIKVNGEVVMRVESKDRESVMRFIEILPVPRLKPGTISFRTVIKLPS